MKINIARKIGIKMRSYTAGGRQEILTFAPTIASLNPDRFHH